MAIQLREQLTQLVSDLFNDTLGDLVQDVVWYRYKGTMSDPNNPSNKIPQYDVYGSTTDSSIKALEESSGGGITTGELTYESREKYKGPIKLTLARKDLPFLPDDLKDIQTRDKFTLGLNPVQWIVTEANPGDSLNATVIVVGNRQV